MHPFLQPRGIRNNNPGNIRLSAQRWQGQKPAQADTDFVEFDAPVMGLRALMKLLLGYQLRHGLDTVESILNRFAPPHENATDNYIHAVCADMKVRRRDPLRLQDAATLAGLARAITRHENGRRADGKEWYPDELYAHAALLARQPSSTSFTKG